MPAFRYGASMHVFEVLGEPVRRRIVELLSMREHSVADLIEEIGPEFGVSRAAVSKHLRTLRDAEFVEYRDYGPQHRYRLAWDALDRLDDEVERLFLAWESRTGWPYDRDLPDPPARLHRAGRKGRRGRSREQIETRAGGDDDLWAFFD
ncbi:hypothetical protein BH11ACT3_BH11ACT3_24980 [soil metagenome]